MFNWVGSRRIAPLDDREKTAGVRLAVVLFLSALPFIGMAWLVWIGPRNSWSARYWQAIDHHDATAEAAEQLNARLTEEGDRLQESQRRLVARAGELRQRSHSTTDESPRRPSSS